MTAEILNGRIIVKFPPLPGRIAKAKTVAGYKFVGEDKGGPGFRYPLEMKVAQDLAAVFAGEILFGPDLKEWGYEQKKRAEEMTALSTGTAGDELLRLPEVLPDLAAWLRPYQRRGVRYIGKEGSNPFVCDHPGLGKTVQVIGGVYEAEMEGGPKLIIAPKTSLDRVWLNELNRWQPQPVFVADEGRESREALMEEILTMVEIDEPFWLVINPAMVTMKRKLVHPGEVFDPNDEWEPPYPELYEVEWNVVVVDETSRAALANLGSGTARGIRALPSKKRIAMEGTPVRGRPVNVWSILHWLEPQTFKAKWRWAEQWLGITEKNGHKMINNGILDDNEEGFYKAHAQYILRRTKAEVAPELPAKQYEIRWCKMGLKQRKQYLEMEHESVMRLEEMTSEDGRVNQTTVIAQLARLKQFSGAYCDVRRLSETDLLVRQTEDSCKLPVLMEILEELGITDPEYENFQDSEKEQVVIFSQFSKMAEMVHGYLEGHGIPSGLLIGDTKRHERNRLGEEFQQGGKIRCLVMTTTAGGVSITLDRASTVVFLDETWVPDDQEQAEDRVHRISRIHQVRVIRILTEGTVEEDINSTNTQRQEINNKVLDYYRIKVQGEVQ